jgi:hypothetical protein
MDNQQRALLHFMQLRSKNPEYDFRFLEHGDRKYLALYVDAAKMDKNSPSYDENYRNNIAPKRDRPRQGLFFPTPKSKKFENLIDDAKKFIGIKEIDDNSCASNVNKFPVNDGFRNFDLLYFIFSILFLILCFYLLFGLLSIVFCYKSHSHI